MNLKEKQHLNTIIQKDYIFQSIIDSIHQATMLSRTKFPYNKQLTSSYFTFRPGVIQYMYAFANVKDNSLIIPIETYLKTRQTGNVTNASAAIAKVKILITFDENNNISYAYDDIDILTSHPNYLDVLDFIFDCLDQADILRLFKRQISSCDQPKYEEDIAEIKQIIETNKRVTQLS